MTHLFDTKSAAEQYARGRPYHHETVIRNVKARLALDRKLDRALDVACGTGLSCIALKEIAQTIIGADGSSEMLKQAPRDERIVYLACLAENLAVGDATVDLVTVSSALHWFDREQFLSEAGRGLKSCGWLVVYNNLFSAEMKGEARFKSWYTTAFIQLFPTPPRDNRPFDEQEAERFGFRFIEREHYTNAVVWDKPQLIRYLMTQTNVIAAVERGGWTRAEVKAFLGKALGRFFASDEKATFRFGGPVWYLRRSA